MASKAAHKRVCVDCDTVHPHATGANGYCQLTREYKAISENPPPYITAHPSESNILEYVALCPN